MTFYELEKECKKRRLKKVFISIGVIFFVILGFIYSFSKNNPTLEKSKIQIKKQFN